jgi:DNA-binding transcriptional LysR family regulator
MEIFELRYFLGVAQFENIHKASEQLSISPGSLSKAITRLEEELGVKLFLKSGRNIHLSHHGRLLQKRASAIVQLEESTRVEVAGDKGSLHVIMAAPETLLSHMGQELGLTLKKKYPLSTIEFVSCTEDEAIMKVSRGEAHLALVTMDHFPEKLSHKIILETSFAVFAGSGHPLKGKKSIPIEDLLTHSFIAPSTPYLGEVQEKQSLDGWRDDKFQRKIDYLTSSLKLTETMVKKGKALAYLPDYIGEEMNLTKLTITGCPYYCKQKIRMVARNPKDTSWLKDIWD